MNGAWRGSAWPQLGGARASTLGQLGTKPLASCLAAVMLFVTSCDNEVNSATEEEPTTPGPEVLEGLDDPVVVNFWHSMDGTAGNALGELVETFNERNEDRIRVEASFQGTEDDTLANYRAALQQNATPQVAMIHELGTQFMIDSADAVPVQDFMDRDDFDAGELEESLLSYFTVNNELRALPFAHSTPMLYLNTEAFTEAGLDPENPPGDLAELQDAAQALTLADNGQVEQYGFGAALSGWYVEQFLARAETPFCTQDNGRSGRADAALLDDPAVVEVIEWWSEIIEEDHSPQLGRNIEDSRTAFTTERVAMTLESSQALPTLMDDSDFEVATAPFPVPHADDPGGSTIDGSALWISRDGHSEREQRAAWEFLRFLLEPSAQEQWHAATGYLALNSFAYELPQARERAEDFPQFAAAAHQVADASADSAATGCVMGAMFEARAAVEDGWERAVTEDEDPEEAMTNAAETAQEAIDEYNEAVTG